MKAIEGMQKFSMEVCPNPVHGLQTSPQVQYRTICRYINNNYNNREYYYHYLLFLQLTDRRQSMFLLPLDCVPDSHYFHHPPPPLASPILTLINHLTQN